MAKEKKAVMDHLGKDAPSEKKSKKYHVHRMTIERADHGGHMVHHDTRDEDGNPGPSQSAVIPDNEALGQHVQDMMGDQPAAGQGQPAAPQQEPDPSQDMQAGQGQ
jgi:hypothetical protein